jgi:hypothetical protein
VPVYVSLQCPADKRFINEGGSVSSCVSQDRVLWQGFTSWSLDMHLSTRKVSPKVLSNCAEVARVESRMTHACW